MEQKFHPYYEWEDYQAGMYDELKDGREQRVQLAIHLLSNCMNLHKFMKEVTFRWKVATETVFTDKKRNKKSWLGQAACCLFAGVKEDETREAWGFLTDEQRIKANATADEIIKEWVENYEQSNDGDKCVGSCEISNFLDF
jgi:hypothetical protein